MSANKSKSTAAAATRSRDTPLTEPVCQRIQNFLLIWLDANLDEKNEDFKRSLKELRRIVASITTFTDALKCFDFLCEIKTEKIFMIVSGALGQIVIPKVEKFPQMDTIYVFCGNKDFHERWAKEFQKIKGVYTKIESICEQLKIDSENCDRATVSISFNGIDPLFIYTQLLKEALLEIEDDDEKSIRELVQFCRDQGDIPEAQIKKVEHEYRDHSPIWWYTYDSFMYSMLNRGLRVMDIDIILKLGFFIRQLHNHIQKLYNEQQSTSTKMKGPFIVYRGQELSLESFEKMKKSKGNLMSFNNFLSTSSNRDISLDNFARPAAFRRDSFGILFKMKIDPQICRDSSVPFADVRHDGHFGDKEEELLFTTHAIFRIEKIKRLKDEQTDRLWEISLLLVGNEDNELHKLVSSMREESNKKGTGWSRFGHMLIKLGEPAKAEHVYNVLLEKKTSNDVERAVYYYQLGWAFNDMGEYSKALSSYERSLEIRKIAFPPNHPDLAQSYNGIGVVHYNMREYLKALSSYERSLEIRKIALPPNDLDLAVSYNNIGNVYVDMGQYLKALSSYERSIEIRKTALPPNHPDLAKSYNNIGNVHYNMGEYSKALSSYEGSLEIKKIALPPNHPELATSYNGIGLVYDKLGEYSTALSYFEKAEKIWVKSLPPSHWYISHVKGNIKNVKSKLT